MNMLGRCHELGTGTPANAALAAVWYRKAADEGLDWGMYNLANLLGTGRGVVRDERAAFALYLRAARLGHAKSMNLVGRCLEDGIGVEPDPAAAPQWYRRSAEAGDFRGQASHASLLLMAGQIDAAVMWLQRALAHGSPSFLAHTLPALAASPYPQVRALAVT
jgi:TPR repeat protein